MQLPDTQGRTVFNWLPARVTCGSCGGCWQRACRASTRGMYTAIPPFCRVLTGGVHASTMWMRSDVVSWDGTQWGHVLRANFAEGSDDHHHDVELLRILLLRAAPPRAFPFTPAQRQMVARAEKLRASLQGGAWTRWRKRWQDLVLLTCSQCVTPGPAGLVLAYAAPIVEEAWTCGLPATGTRRRRDYPGAGEPLRLRRSTRIRRRT